MPPAENKPTLPPQSLVTQGIEFAESGLDEAVTPIPPRYWWLKRLTIAVGPVLLVLLVIRIGWGWVAARQLQAEIDKYVAAGEPIYPKDFDSPPVPDKDNAAKLYRDAAEKLTHTSDDLALLSNWETLGNLEENRKAIASLLANNAGILQKLRKARTCKVVEWGKKYRSPMIKTVMQYNLAGVRSLSKLLALAATHAETKGDANETVEYLLDAIAMADATDVHPTLLEHLVSIAQYALVTRLIERMIPSLRVCEYGTNSAEDSKCVPLETIEKLRDAIKDAHLMNASMTYAIHVERAIFLDSLATVWDANVSTASAARGVPVAVILQKTPALLVRPVFLIDTIFTLRQLSKMTNAMKVKTWTNALTFMPRTTPPTDIIDEWTHMLSQTIMPSIVRSNQLHFRAMALRKMAGVALAIRLYELDRGHRPESLKDLIPDYLDALPIDPYGDGEQTFGYLPNAMWPRVYSLGPDGVDNGGKLWFSAPSRIDWQALDMPFFLDGPAPKSQQEFEKPRGSNKQTADDNHGEDKSRHGKKTNARHKTPQYRNENHNPHGSAGLLGKESP